MLSSQLAVEPGLEAWIRFLRAHASLTRQLSARLESEHGLTLNDFDVLAQLAHAEDRQLRRVDLSRSVLLTASGITRLLDGLEHAGWVEKGTCTSDARVTYAVLTDDGLAKYRRVRTSHLADIEALFGSRFTEEDQSAFSRLLLRLLEPGDDETPSCATEPE